MSVRIAFTDPHALIERCDTTEVRIAAGLDDVEDSAVIPTDDWRPLTPVQAQHLRATASDNPSTVTEIVSVLADWSVAAPSRPLLEHVAGFDPFAGRYGADFLAAVDEQPGQPTTTIDPGVGLRLGIHLDNHDKLPLAERTSSRRRVGLNLGPGHRYLLLGTTDVLDICAANGADRRYYPHTNDIRRHVAAGRPLRLLRIRLDPGDAYITPTELVPHDGSTLAAKDPSRIAFWLGHWPTGTLESLI
ncbi:hypothetical protein [Catenulispora pinisilvae]|uniref:hypothetical protein n=1 Tax=Catenulispora pinisilvae TaxID=2705253 RepID=UPI001892009B|nr:hypothetical protein [Catenulispora pinisilvae]